MNDPNLPGPDLPETLLPETLPPVAAEQPQRIGRYRVERILGDGGFGRVYLAHDEQLQRPVAVKVPHRRLVSRPEDAEAYQTEARTVAGLDHPNIVPVYDVGSTEDCPCFVVSKYIDGSTLALRIQANRPSVAEAAELTATVAETLHYAHRKGLVHRDIKPGNILLDTCGKPFVADFGLALREQDIGKGPRYAGTPAYMSPEQARGEGHRVDGRSDIFSLGVVLYELLTGRRPFHADSQAELLEEVATHEARPPRQWDDTIPKELERICLKALSKRASERYTAAKDMAEDLRHFLSSPQPEAPKGLPSALLADTGNLLQQMGLSGQRAKVARSTFLFADFKGFTERVRILEKAAGHQAAAEMKRQVAHHVEEAFRRLQGDIKPADYALIDTAGDGFFFHFRSAKDAFRFAEALHQLTTAHNAQVTDEIAEHWFRTGAATGDVAWDEGKPVGHVVNVGSRLQSAATGGDFVIDQATYDDLAPDMQQQFGPKESIRDKHDKTYDVYRTAFGRALPPLPVSNPTNLTTPVLSPVPTPALSAVATPASDSQPIRIVPKGLRSFDAHDADFFLELLPGPRDRDGLPDGIRFWKTRIEETDADNTFTVGLIYGPSGCGKSSLVKAGLLPRLSDRVIAVYVEATAEETETRLLHGLRKRCPALSGTLGLKETLAALRRGQGVPVGKKVVIVLDQFEQWLHAKKEETNTELVQALRHCDGGRVQCVVMVRDDFWMAATRFMRDLEVRLLEAQNSAAVDLFPIRHAEKVLAAFGRAFGVLPDGPGEASTEQKEFLNQAVSGLSQEGKVISVRLALFSEMMKGKAWTPTTLKEVGGTEGVGVTFLEGTFSAAAAPPEHRYHQKAARAVLKSLLPESGTDIKGHMRSYAELLDASGYGSRPKDFDDLLRILDGEIRLITPTDPEGKEGVEESTSQVQPGQRYYQLTHDYLVPSLREWLTRKQKETRRGRAELLLADRAAVWNARPENRQLPSLSQWLRMRWLTAKKNWTPPQRKMMGKAARVHVLRAAAIFLVVLLLGWIGYEVYGRLRAESLVESIATAETADVPGLVKQLPAYRRWADPRLLQRLHDSPEASKEHLHASLALLPVDGGQAEYLYQRLLEAGPTELPVIRDALFPRRQALGERLWGVLEDGKGDADRRFRAACALAGYDVTEDDANRKRWEGVSPFVADRLLADVQSNPSDYTPLLKTLDPVRDRLVGPLSEVFRSGERAESDRLSAANLLAEYAADRAEVLAGLLLDADEKQFAVIYPKFQAQGEQGLPVLNGEIDKKLPSDLPSSDEKREKLAKRQANAAVALLRMNRPEKVWPLLKRTPPDDPRVRSYLIHRLSPLGADAGAIGKRLEEEPDVTIRRALILSLGEFDPDSIAERQALTAKLLQTYREAADPGLHGAAEWLLRQRKQEDKLQESDEQLKKEREQRIERIREYLTRRDASAAEANPVRDATWYVNGEGQTIVVVPGPMTFQIGSPPTEEGREGGAEGKNEKQMERRIGRSFAIAAKAVTVEEFQKFRPQHEYDKQVANKPNCPMNDVTWYDAAAYCNWLSEREGLEAVYEPNEDKQYGPGMRLKAGYLELSGYRLPTESEWEYACRAEAVTSRYYGETEELLGKYAWYMTYSHDRWMLPVGSRKPNDLGLFDMQGNALQWCEDRAALYSAGEDKEDKDDIKAINTDDVRVLRGGSFFLQASNVRSALRIWYAPSLRDGNVGFRLARTFAP